MKNNLTAPCSYQGGKQRLAPQIIDIILEQNEINEHTKFYDLCCGSGSIAIELVNRDLNIFDITMIDASPWGLFWEKVGNGIFSMDTMELYLEDLPSDISKIKEYAVNMSKLPANDGILENMVYKFLILQACAFGSTATWVENNQWKKAGGFRNYWEPTKTSNRRSHVNPMMPMPKTLLARTSDICAKMDFVKGIYGKVEDSLIVDSDNTIIYIDPPYDKTCKYGYEFDYMSFIKRFSKSKIYLSEGSNLNNGICLSKGRSKGNISGESKKKPSEEWLNVFNLNENGLNVAV